MIKSLQISGYKLFDHLSISRFGRLNLFVGENNTGKSCLLEAIGLYAGRSPIADIITTASKRSLERLQPWEADNIIEAGSSLRHPVFQLFKSDETAIDGSITIGQYEDPRPLLIRQRFHQTIIEDGLRRYVPLEPGDILEDPIEMALQIYRGDEQVGLMTRRSLPLRSTSLGEKLRTHEAAVVAHVPAFGFSDEQAAAMWDGLVQGPGQEQVLDLLRIIDPSIQDLVYIAGRMDRRIALLKLRNASRVPLRSMGDGLTRLFHIGLAIASSGFGILLIDEFENGLHWKAQEKVWIALAKATRDLHMQVFATTHSRDCIESFVTASATVELADSSIYRLERLKGEVFATELPMVNVDAALHQNSEVR